jgi:hypothetical protein
VGAERVPEQHRAPDAERVEDGDEPRGERRRRVGADGERLGRPPVAAQVGRRGARAEVGDRAQHAVKAVRAAPPPVHRDDRGRRRRVARGLAHHGAGTLAAGQVEPADLVAWAAGGKDGVGRQAAGKVAGHGARWEARRG